MNGHGNLPFWLRTLRPHPAAPWVPGAGRFTLSAGACGAGSQGYSYIPLLLVAITTKNVSQGSSGRESRYFPCLRGSA